MIKSKQITIDLFILKKYNQHFILFLKKDKEGARLALQLKSFKIFPSRNANAFCP